MKTLLCLVACLAWTVGFAGCAVDYGLDEGESAEESLQALDFAYDEGEFVLQPAPSVEGREFSGAAPVPQVQAPVAELPERAQAPDFGQRVGHGDPSPWQPVLPAIPAIPQENDEE